MYIWLHFRKPGWRKHNIEKFSGELKSLSLSITVPKYLLWVPTPESGEMLSTGASKLAVGLKVVYVLLVVPGSDQGPSAHKELGPWSDCSLWWMNPRLDPWHPSGWGWETVGYTHKVTCVNTVWHQGAWEVASCVWCAACYTGAAPGLIMTPKYLPAVLGLVIG